MSSIFNKRELNVFEWSFFLPSFVIFPHLSLASPNLTYTSSFLYDPSISKPISKLKIIYLVCNSSNISRIEHAKRMFGSLNLMMND